MRRRFVTEEEDEINLTPMLDVVFIMLIFFIVTASFVKESGIDVDKPGPKQDDEIIDDSSKKITILVSINASDQIWIENRVVDPRTVRANIQRILAKHPDSSVLVQADRNSQNQTLVKVLDAANLAGVANVTVTSD
ncbi:MAG: biopolymer transporter ExbD [Myxococcota bacterium]|nr:biopolymer transporter ExbD [Myxococcota bacterium]